MRITVSPTIASEQAGFVLPRLSLLARVVHLDVFNWT